MIDWESSLKRYLVKKFKDTIGLDVDEDSITSLKVNTNIDIRGLELEELVTVYAFALMREDFEMAKEIADEVKGRNARITFTEDEDGKTGVINLYIEPEISVSAVEMYMTITTDGVLIDWEKQKF